MTLSYEEQKTAAALDSTPEAVIARIALVKHKQGATVWTVQAGNESWDFPNGQLAYAFANGWNESLKQRVRA